MAKSDQAKAEGSGGVEQTPEFKAAVAEAVKEAAGRIQKEIIAKLSVARDGRQAEPGDATGDQRFAESVAMAIASLTDQGVGRKTVAPKILRQRAEARQLMTELIVEAKAAGEKPVYKLRNKIYVDEVLVEPIWIAPDHTQRATEIEWQAVPNEAMIPVNDVAKRIFKAFQDSIGSVENAPQERPIAGVTAGGLVIKSGSRAVQPVRVLDEHGQPPSTEGGLSVLHKGKSGQYKEVHVLGSVAAPARQTV